MVRGSSEPSLQCWLLSWAETNTQNTWGNHNLGSDQTGSSLLGETKEQGSEDGTEQPGAFRVLRRRLPREGGVPARTQNQPLACHGLPVPSGQAPVAVPWLSSSPTSRAKCGSIRPSGEETLTPSSASQTSACAGSLGDLLKHKPVGPNPDVLIQSVRGGAREFTYLTSSPRTRDAVCTRIHKTPLQ